MSQPPRADQWTPNELTRGEMLYTDDEGEDNS